MLLIVPTAISVAAAKPKAKTPATITSDDLELRDNGAVTIFTGHVVLKQDPYLIHADRMERTKGIWTAPDFIKGERLSDGQKERTRLLK